MRGWVVCAHREPNRNGPPACNQDLLTRPTAPGCARELAASPPPAAQALQADGSSPPPPWPRFPDSSTQRCPEGLPPTCCFLQVPPGVMLGPRPALMWPDGRVPGDCPGLPAGV